MNVTTEGSLTVGLVCSALGDVLKQACYLVLGLSFFGAVRQLDNEGQHLGDNGELGHSTSNSLLLSQPLEKSQG